MRKLYLVLALVVPACLADVSDAPDEPVGAAVERGLHHGAYTPGTRTPPGPAPYYGGPCGDTCYDLPSDLCGDWESECADEAPSAKVVECAGKTVSCEAARRASAGDTIGIGWCWRECEGYHDF
jgi:hypothetical protein